MKVKPFTYNAHCPQATAAGGPWDSDREQAWKCQLCRHRTPAQSVPQPLGEAKLHQNDALGSTLSSLLSPRGSPSLLQLTLLGASGSAVPTAALLTLPRTLPWGFTAHHDMRNCSASRVGAWHAVPLLLLVLRQKPPLQGAWVCVTSDPTWMLWASLVGQRAKNPPAMLETWVRSPGWEDPLEKGKATHSSILAWRIPWTV